MEIWNLKLTFFCYDCSQCCISCWDEKACLCCEMVWVCVSWIRILSWYYLVLAYLFPTAHSCVFVFSLPMAERHKGSCVSHTHRMTCSFHHPERSYSLLLFPPLCHLLFGSYLSNSFHNFFPPSQTTLTNVLAMRHDVNHTSRFRGHGQIAEFLFTHKRRAKQ